MRANQSHQSLGFGCRFPFLTRKLIFLFVFTLLVSSVSARQHFNYTKQKLQNQLYRSHAYELDMNSSDTMTRQRAITRDQQDHLSLRAHVIKGFKGVKIMLSGMMRRQPDEASQDFMLQCVPSPCVPQDSGGHVEEVGNETQGRPPNEDATLLRGPMSKRTSSTEPETSRIFQ